MTDYDFLLIGAGILGLSTARELQQRYPGSRVCVVEKEQVPAYHQTGHNSGVIHAGVYYTPGSLKARFCFEGNRAIKSFCREHRIEFDECGKLLVATNLIEVERMQVLIERSKQNGLTIDVLDHKQLVEAEPNISGLSAIRVPSTGIVSYSAICHKLAELIESDGGEILYGSHVDDLTESDNDVIVRSNARRITTRKLIGCGGVMADRLVRSLGGTPDFQIIPFRGDYYRLAAHHNQIIRHLIYPIPDPALPFLGVHLTRMIDGSVTVGPNAVVNFSREGYSRFAFDSGDALEMVRFPGFRRVVWKNLSAAMQELKKGLWKPSFLKEVQKYSPGVQLGDLQPYPPGIRAQAVSADGRLVDDFLFYHTGNSLIVCNAPSPAATSCFPIARHIVDQLSDQ
ncbi:MAG TPA: L-2-hydroxyglutarate oxidase [Gammaproteobacteria bacterium]|nr:L-2-hydroxyglutarate oxidase [Gammaproteobacteria bacterium]PHS09048.1 MAG: L-2-hydroxyglutarate oxidase [Acidithiobacillus sp.]RTZ65791.1 MAG: L-2-hydroxyglutarate oxidase [Gammaproteobacteria bacterium]HAD36226.1 L-2-hydroxyglutarate oxidase [Gammaproteobacteria bacterium]HBK76289.1 L-2-hydroxyglutarate oxidase [Gammaproteobacteria bacterium]